MVATSARRACVIHEMGNITRRILIPTTYRIGMTTMEMRASTQLMLSMKPKATTPIKHCTMMSGAKMEYICTLRISLLTRLIELAGLDAVVEAERKPGQVLVDERSQSALNVVGRVVEELS